MSKKPKNESWIIYWLVGSTLAYLLLHQARGLETIEGILAALIKQPQIGFVIMILVILGVAILFGYQTNDKK